MDVLRTVETRQQLRDEALLKTVGAVRRLYNKVFGAGAYGKIRVGKKAEESEAKVDINVSPEERAEYLSKEEHERYKKAKKKLAEYAGTTTHYGRGIVSQVKEKLEDKEEAKKSHFTTLDAALEALEKARTHKYIKRERKGNKWIYYYKTPGGKIISSEKAPTEKGKATAKAGSVEWAQKVLEDVEVDSSAAGVVAGAQDKIDALASELESATGIENLDEEAEALYHKAVAARHKKIAAQHEADANKKLSKFKIGTTYKKNDTVTALEDFQGMKKGESGRIVDIDEQDLGIFGKVVQYKVELADGTEKWLSNAHLLTQKKEESSAEKKEESKVYKDKYGEFFGRVNDEGTVDVLHTSGEAATRLDASVYPAGSSLSARYEHTSGISLSKEDAKKIGLPIEKSAVSALGSTIEELNKALSVFKKRNPKKSPKAAEQKMQSRIAKQKRRDVFGTTKSRRKQVFGD